MKNTILGKIIQENVHNNGLRNKINQLHLKLNKCKDVPEQQSISAEIQKLQKEAVREDEIRQNLIDEIEKFTGRTLITYFSDSFLEDRDVRIMEDFIKNSDVKAFDILIDSPGGITDSAEKLIKICREHTKTGEDTFDFRVIVVGRAKSAATLFALGSKQVLLCNTAELGPTDPQIPIFTSSGKFFHDSAHQIYYSAKKYQKKDPCESDIVLLSKYDPILIEKAHTAIDHTNDIIRKSVLTNPYLGEGYANSLELQKDLKIFTEHLEGSFSHGRAIFFDDIEDAKFAKNNFFIKFDSYYSEIEKKPAKEREVILQKLWELYVRSIETVRNNSIEIIQDGSGKVVGNRNVNAKLFETKNGLVISKSNS